MSTYPNEQRQENAPAGNTDKSVCLPEGAKRQIDTVAGRSSITNIKEQAVSATGQKLGDAKQTILNDVVPAATGALQNIQENLRSIAGGDNAVDEGQSKEDATDRTHDAEDIDQMYKVDVSDFLRKKHMSTKSPPSTK